MAGSERIWSLLGWGVAVVRPPRGRLAELGVSLRDAVRSGVRGLTGEDRVALWRCVYKEQGGETVAVLELPARVVSGCVVGGPHLVPPTFIELEVAKEPGDISGNVEVRTFDLYNYNLVLSRSLSSSSSQKKK